MMRRWIMFTLLVSLGINVGLGLRVMRPGPGPEDKKPRSEHWAQGQRSRGLAGGDQSRHDMPDSTRMRKIGERRLEKLIQELGLSQEQSDFFRAGHRKHGPIMGAQRKKVIAARHQLQEIIAAGEGNTEQVRQAIHYLGHQEIQLDSLMTEVILSEMEILEPGQRARYLEILPVFKGMGADKGQARGNRRSRHK